MTLDALKDIRISSSEGKIIISAKKEIILTSGGGYIRIADGTVECAAPDKITTAVIYKIPSKVIPVIFLPGVMGSNLKTIGDGPSDELWRLDGASSAASWLLSGPIDRRRKLNPKKVIVDSSGKIDNNLADSNFSSRSDRGWGEGGYMSYGEFLPWLQNALNDFENAKNGERSKLIGKELNIEIGRSPLTKEEVKLSYEYLFPLHVVGYNWLDSIEVASVRLSSKIHNVIEEYQSKGFKCGKVILVTHSMGGLVARYCSELKNTKDKILGVVHGVLPATGAASAYRRMKAGMEYDVTNFISKSTAEVAGGNAAEMTAVLSQSPGPLQLLPSTAYGMCWFKIMDDKNIYNMPIKNPYEEIYTVRGKWWSLCEDYLIEPSNKKFDQKKMDADWNDYNDLILLQVQPIIESMIGHYHKNTHSFYGGNTPTLGDFVWKGSTSYLDEKFIGKRESFPLDGKLTEPLGDEVSTVRTVATRLGGKGWKKGIHQKYEMVDPTDVGDGTVPLRSSQIPEKYLKSRCRLPVEHEPAYKHPAARQYTLWALLKIVQEVKNTSIGDSSE